MARKTRRSSSKTRRSTRKTASRSSFTRRSRGRASAPRRVAKRVSRKSVSRSRGQTIRLVLEQQPAAPAVGDAPTAIANALAQIAANRSGGSKPQKAKF